MRGKGAFFNAGGQHGSAVGGGGAGGAGVRLGVVDAGEPHWQDGYRCQCHLWWTGQSGKQ